MTRSVTRRWAIAAAAVLVAVSAYAGSRWGLSKPDGPGPEPVGLATGESGGLCYAFGQMLAHFDVRDNQLRTRVTAGSLENMELLGQHEVAFALVAADVAEEYLARTPAAAHSVRAVGRLYDSFVNLVVRADLPVHTPADLRRLRVSVGSPGSGTALATDRILSRAGIDPQRDLDRVELGLADSVTAIADQRIDALFVSDGAGSPAVTGLTRDLPVRLVDLTDVASRLRAEEDSPYQVGDVPAASYPGLAVPIATLTVPTLLLTTTAVSDDVVERMTRMLFDSAPRIARSLPAIGRIDRHAAIFTGPIALHDGAAAYYRSAKTAE